MSKSYRAGNGKFVSRSNPVAVVGRLREAKQRERDAQLVQAARERRETARKAGYRGPITREELAQLVRERSS
jgi:hypothetical protein